MHEFVAPLLLALAFAGPAAAQDKSKAGSGASTEGGASLGGTGIDSGVANPRGVDETDKRFRIERRPKPGETEAEKQEEERRKKERESRK